MTKVDFKTNRTLREWLALFPSGWIDKSALIILSCWCCFPIALMAINYVFYEIADIIHYMVMISVGFFGILIGILSFLKSHFSTSHKRLSWRELLKYHGDRFFLFAMLVWGFLSCFFAKDVSLAFLGNAYRREGFFTYIAYAGFFISAVVLKKEKYRKILLHFLCAISTIMAVLTILQFYGIRIRVFINYGKMYSAIFFNSNHYGYYLAITMLVITGMLIFQKKWWIKITYAIALAVSVFALAINNTFAAYWAVAIGMLFAIIFLGIKKSERLVILLIPFLIFVSVSIIVDVNHQLVRGNFGGLFDDFFKIANQKDLDTVGTNRIKLWGDSLKIIKKEPIFGCGIEGFLNGYDDTMVITYNRPHNEYLQHAVFMGIPSAILYLMGLGWIIGRACKRGGKAKNSTLIVLCAVIGYCFSAFFGNTMFYTTPYFIMILGMASKVETDDNMIG